MKGMVRFENKGKLSPRYVVPYEISQKIGKVAYELRLPREFASVHPVFHVLMHTKCIRDAKSIIPIKGLCFQENLSYEEVPIEILDRQLKRLRNKVMAFVKVLWKNNIFKGER